MPDATATDLRRGVERLTRLANRDLDIIWQRVRTGVQARNALADVLPPLIDKYGAAAATLAAQWYDDLREQAEVKGRFSAIPADIRDSGTDELARWAVAPLFQAEPDWMTARTKVHGGLQRRITNFSRQTVAGSSIADPNARGWQRIGAGACAFCAMLISRGAVYSEASADFASHDHCHCAAVPAWEGHSQPVKPYTPSSRNITDADRARVREYLRTH